MSRKKFIPKSVKLEIPLAIYSALLQQNALPVNLCRCLDNESKLATWQLLLDKSLTP